MTISVNVPDPSLPLEHLLELSLLLQKFARITTPHSMTFCSRNWAFIVFSFRACCPFFHFILAIASSNSVEALPLETQLQQEQTYWSPMEPLFQQLPLYCQHPLAKASQTNTIVLSAPGILQTTKGNKFVWLIEPCFSAITGPPWKHGNPSPWYEYKCRSKELLAHFWRILSASQLHPCDYSHLCPSCPYF